MPDGKRAEAEYERELREAIDRIVDSSHPKRVVVAGPGAGKTSLFKQLLSRSKKANTERSHLVLTFISELADELKRDLGGLADVSTFHGHCKLLLHRNPYLREGLQEGFVVFPKLPSLIKSDWLLLTGDAEAPHFVKLMRQAVDDAATGFFLNRSNYYNAVGFDDMVFRVYRKLLAKPYVAERRDLLLVDEYQDFNLLEVSILKLLSDKSPIVIVGDDDQVLYGALRSSNWNFIRDIYSSPDYQACELPFCLRCPEVVVNAFEDVVRAATKAGYLQGRIPKPYRYFPPYKEDDSVAHPKIDIVRTSIQKRGSGNYFGRVVERAVRSIPSKYIKDSHERGYPTVLVIGNKQYLGQVSAYLKEQGYTLSEREHGEGEDEKITREDGLKILKEDTESTLGWRIMFEIDRPVFFTAAAGKIITTNPLGELIPREYRGRILTEAQKLEVAVAEKKRLKVESGRPTIKLTSYQSAKGLSANYVFVIGLHDGDLPRKPDKIDDIEVCKFLVALTRTRKKCYLLWTNRFAGIPKKPSIFLSWIGSSRKRSIYVDAAYFRETRKPAGSTSSRE